MNHGFHLVPAFSLVTLAEKLAERLAERADPFAPETVLVMNFAQRVWLQRFLAEKLGVCANVEFCAPERFLEKLVSRPSENVFARDAFAWKIFLELRRSREAASVQAEQICRAAQENFSAAVEWIVKEIRR